MLKNTTKKNSKREIKHNGGTGKNEEGKKWKKRSSQKGHVGRNFIEFFIRGGMIKCMKGGRAGGK